ncbi:protein BOLA2-like [Arachis hypogaea]|uniref:protein BOLA2-like n=1 Tax=Arachis hypogaea TaxID=3818 RepID=UPI003B226AEF
MGVFGSAEGEGLLYWHHLGVNARVSLNLKCKKLQVESCLKSKLNPTHLEVVDTSGGCGASFVVDIVSEEFEGKRILERHRMVNAALEEEMKEIHTLSVKKAVTPEQWKQLQQDCNQANPAA